MKPSIKSAVSKSIMLALAGLVCQPVFAGVSVYLNIINNTQADFSVSTCPPSVACADNSQTASVAKGQTATNITSVELARSYYYTPAKAIFPIYLNGSTTQLCTVTFDGETYAVGAPPRIRKEVISISNLAKNDLICSLSEPVLKSKTSDSSGDTEHIFIVVNPKPGGVMAPLNPALAPTSPAIASLNPSLAPIKPAPRALANTYVKSDKAAADGPWKVLYTVTCKNGTVSTFGPDHDGDCYNYTNGQVTYATPMTCDNLNGRARYPTLAEYRQLIGEPFCGNIKTSDLTPALCRMPQ